MKMETRMITQLTTNRSQPDSEDDYVVEGYATTFEPYELFRDGDDVIYEHIHKEAFDSAKRDDVILQYDHEGRVYARTSNDTLTLTIDDHGLKVRADLSKTEGSRQLYEDIKAGMITKMSWRFSVDERSYDTRTKTINIRKVGRVYDVSAVSIPANDDTEIKARYKTYEDEHERQKQRIKLKLKLKGASHV